MKTKLHLGLAVGILSLAGVSTLALSKPAANQTNSPAAQATKVASNTAISGNVINAATDQSAASPTHIVELFTSQGCSSCPPANKFVGQIADQDGVLALTYGVTYWDYLGWKDTFGDPSFTKRQREYRPILGTSNIYTPQIVLNGTEHSPRYSEKDVLAVKLAEDAASSYLKVEDGKLMIDGTVPKGSTVALVSYLPGAQEVAVKRGENGGRTLKLTNVVVDVKKMSWKGKPLITKVKAEDGLAYAALFHSKQSGKIISAATYAP